MEIYDFACEDDDISGLFEINVNLIGHLLNENGAWERNAWYQLEEQQWANIFTPNQGCFITKRALAEMGVTYMYRETPDENHPDSGWRFFYGDETDQYLSQSENINLKFLER
ncbi:MAG: DUF2185 domain-containing protein [Cellulosilyticum sp.]|nr:DUF2185 domain-containing protein [Cellulosilyticum sp.]